MLGICQQSNLKEKSNYIQSMPGSSQHEAVGYGAFPSTFWAWSSWKDRHLVGKWTIRRFREKRLYVYLCLKIVALSYLEMKEKAFGIGQEDDRSNAEFFKWSYHISYFWIIFPECPNCVFFPLDTCHCKMDPSLKIDRKAPKDSKTHCFRLTSAKNWLNIRDIIFNVNINFT